MAVQIPCLRCRATAVADDNAQAVTCPSCSLALPPPGAAAWMVSREGGEPFGPYAVTQLRDYIAQGNVLSTDNLWYQGAPGWVPAGQLSALAPGGAVAPQQAQPQQPAYGQPQGAPAYGQPQYGQPQFGQQPAYGVPQGAYGGGGYGGAPGYGAARAGFGVHMRRAVNWNLGSIEILPEERAQLIANGVDDDHAGRFLLWRRSVLIAVAPITLASGLLALLSAILNERNWGIYSGFGIFVDLLRILSLFALPAAAFMAAQIWYRQRRSRHVLLVGWLTALATPLVLGLIPFSWLVNLNGASNPLERAQAAAGIGFFGAILIYVTLMPAVLSLIPGVLRACLRIKALLPEATLPGWFLVTATPLYILLFLVIFSVINQVAGNVLLIFGVLALLISPCLYMFNASTFTRPLRGPGEVGKIGSVQTMAVVISLIGLLLLLLWTFLGHIGGENGPTLLGFQGSSMLRPWNARVLQFPVDFFGRSMFTTVVVADLIMQMNVAMWRHDKMSEGVPEAAHYDHMMAEIEEAGARTEVRQPQPY